MRETTMIRAGRNTLDRAGIATALGMSKYRADVEKPWNNPGFPRTLNGRPGRRVRWLWDEEEVLTYRDQEAEPNEPIELVSRDPHEDPDPADLLDYNDIARLTGRTRAQVQNLCGDGYLPLADDPHGRTYGVPHVRRAALAEYLAVGITRPARGRPRKDDSERHYALVAQALADNPRARLSELARATGLSRPTVQRLRAQVEQEEEA
ncbi:helix-turn-helix domain-containing protein [Saccharopolyspora griseoalba]|uniref:Helix-turn-helix domain-containing protein n=1 Tax=Saccharopolyspora griseoalba TaxID=1431848 RepID=A0ABW2LUN1_9PSEU